MSERGWTPARTGCRRWPRAGSGSSTCRRRRTTKATLIRALGALPTHVSYVPLNLTKPDAVDVLAGAGTGRTLLICEAVTMYLADEAAQFLRPDGRKLAVFPGERIALATMEG